MPWAAARAVAAEHNTSPSDYPTSPLPLYGSMGRRSSVSAAATNRDPPKQRPLSLPHRLRV